METSRPVIVKRAPERLNNKQARKFMDELKPVLHKDRPQLVLDLSNVKHLDAAGVDMLLRCMSDAMRRDGDMKLAALSPQSAVVLELTRTDRLFEIYENSTDAVRSFSTFLPNMLKQFYPTRHASDPRVHHVPAAAAKPASSAAIVDGDSEAAA